MSSFEASPATPDRVGHPADDPTDRRRGMTGGQTLLFAVAGGVAVGNLYWAQPLLAEIADSLGIWAGTAGLLVT